jgi:hypothetical protein
MNPFTPRPIAAQQRLSVGQHVHVNHNASWRPATVTAVSRTTIGVAYTAGHQLAATVAAWAVQPAQGAALRPARLLGFGDDILFGTSTRTVAATPRFRRDGWLVVPFTEGPAATVLPSAVLRLRRTDLTPPVTVNGVPLAQVLT